MEKIECVQAAPLTRKEKKKKQAKDELDRIKQAEKKKRRLEKALANSAAIRCELEKKKQKKLEEQRRLDEEGARVAEAVALRVLCDDADDSFQVIFNGNQSFDFSRSGYRSNIDQLTAGWRASPSYESYPAYAIGNNSWASGVPWARCRWNEYAIGRSFSSGMVGRDVAAPFLQETCSVSDISPGFIAAQAVSSLRIAEDICNEINLYREA